MRRLFLAPLFVLPLVLVACGDDGPPAGLSVTANEGREIANSNGCAACHGKNGGGGTGPSFVGLAGSEVQLEGGETVIADDAYLIQSIKDPSSQKVDGYGIAMPENSLTDAEIDKVVEYIKGLG